jgi:hypothetical protein
MVNKFKYTKLFHRIGDYPLEGSALRRSSPEVHCESGGLALLAISMPSQFLLGVGVRPLHSQRGHCSKVARLETEILTGLLKSVGRVGGKTK